MFLLDRLPLSSRANLAWAVAGAMTATAAQWLVVIVLSRLGNPEVTGYYSYALAVTGPIVVFANFNLRTIQATDVRDEFAFRDFLRLRSGLLALAAVAIGIAAGVQGNSRTMSVMLLIGAAKLVEALSDVAHGFFQRVERMDLIAISVMVRAVLTVVAVAAVYGATRNLSAACAAALIVTAAVAWLFDRAVAVALLARSGHNRGTSSRPGRRRRLRTLFVLAWPLGAMALLDALLPNLPRYYLKAHYGLGAVGIYSAVAYLMFLGNFFITALGQAATPRLASAYHTSAAAFRRVVWQLTAIGTALGVAGVVFALVAGRFMLQKVYGPAFAAHAVLFVWVMVGAGIFYVTSLLWYATVAARRIPSQAIIQSVAVGVTAAACAILVPRAGLLGASWALNAGFVVRLVGCAVALVGVRTPAVADRDDNPIIPEPIQEAMPALAGS